MSDRTDMRQDNRLELINEIGRAVSGTLDLRVLYDRIYEQIGRVMDTSLFFIVLHRSGTTDIDLQYLREQGTLIDDEQVEYGDNVTSLVIDRGTPLNFQSLREYQEFGSLNGLGDISIGEHTPEAMIFVPLTTGDETIGALSVQSMRPNAYSTDDVQTLSVIASQAAVAIQNAHLYARSETNVRRMRALLHVARVINSSLDLQTVMDSILEGVRDVIPYYLAAILMPDWQNRQLDVVGAAGPLADAQKRTIKAPFGRGVTGTVFETGRPLNVGDVRMLENYVDHGLDLVRSELAVPLKHGDDVVGVLDVERTEIDSFTDEDIEVLTLFASQAAIAIENARLFEEQQKRVVELQTIQTIVQEIAPLHGAPAIAGVINRELKQLINYHTCRIFLLNADEQVLVAVGPPGTEPAEAICLPLGEGISGWVAERGSSAIISNSLTDERCLYIPGTPLREESILSVPLTYEGRVRGVITLSCLGTGQFDENALRLLEIIAAQTAIALDRTRLYDELRTEAITDPVTRLFNRRHLQDRFREERSRALRKGQPLMAIMLDIDKFKLVNDTYGHDAGDIVLQELGQLVRGMVRQEDLTARYGGEEFCILLPGIPLADAAGVAERVRRTVAEQQFSPLSGMPSLTVSVGVASLWRDDRGNEIFTRADLAMYHAKHNGGDLVCVASQDGHSFTYSAGIEDGSRTA